MNRRFRASELALDQISQNLAPAGNVRATPRGESSLLAPRGGTPSVDALRRDALEALHTYVVAACEYQLPRSLTVFTRVTRTLDSLLDPVSERSRPQ